EPAALVRAAGTGAEAPDPGERRVLYQGSPSWRAYFPHYALLALATLGVPALLAPVCVALLVAPMTLALAVTIPLAAGGLDLGAFTYYRKSQVYRISTTTIEHEYGILTRKIDVVELWRCRDIRYRQSLSDRVLGVAHIEVFTADVTTPTLLIPGLPASRRL